MSGCGVEYKTIELSEKAAERAGTVGELDAYSSTWTTDDVGDRFVEGAFAESLRTRSHRPLLLHHDHTRPVGAELALVEDGHGLRGRWRFADTADGREARTLVRSGAIRRMSVGFIPKKVRELRGGGREILVADLLENSLVAVAANPAAEVLAVKGGSMVHEIEATARRLAAKGIISLPARDAIGARVANHPELRSLMTRGGGQPARVVLPDVTLKALTNPPSSVTEDRPDLSTAGVVAPSVLDYLAQIETTSGSVQVPRSSRPSGASAVSPNGLKPEILVAYAATPLPMAWIAGFIQATTAVLDDADGLAQLVDGDLRLAVRDEAERQVLEGSGVAPEMRGIWSTSGVLTLTATAGQELAALIDAIGDVVQASKRMPTVAAVSMGSWPTVLKAIAATGAVTSAPNLLGIPLVPSAGLTAGRALVGCGPTAPLFVQRGLAIEAGWINNGFLRNIVHLRGEMSAVVAPSKPEAWCAVSGLGTS